MDLDDKVVLRDIAPNAFDDEFNIEAVLPKPPVTVETSLNTPVKVQKVVDLNDGSGPQVYEGEGATRELALEAVTDKLVTAQAHATRKIQKLSRQRREPVAQVPDEAPAPLTSDEEFALAQSFESQPKRTFERLHDAMYGMSVEQVKRRLTFVDSLEAKIHSEEESQSFVASTPEFYPSPRNSKALLNYLEEEGLEITADNLTSAYHELTSSGLLETKPTPVAIVESAPRIEVQPRKPENTNVPRLPAPAEQVEDTREQVVKEAHTIPLAELKRRINAQARSLSGVASR